MVPNHLLKSILEEYRNGRMAGGFCGVRVYAALSRQWWRRTMYRDALEFNRNCGECATVIDGTGPLSILFLCNAHSRYLEWISWSYVIVFQLGLSHKMAYVFPRIGPPSGSLVCLQKRYYCCSVYRMGSSQTEGSGHLWTLWSNNAQYHLIRTTHSVMEWLNV